MTHSLKLAVVAEGIETEAQLEYLSDKGCDAMQGHLFSAAVTADQLTVLLCKTR